MSLADAGNPRRSKPRFMRGSLVSLVVITVLTGSTIAAVFALSAPRSRSVTPSKVWLEHRKNSLSIPDEDYRRDRFRAIRGRVTDVQGEPISDATVRCSRVVDLIELATKGVPSDARWFVPIFAETRTDSKGRYNFSSLPIGAYTFFYSARGLGKAIKELIVVQDGLGAVLDVELDRPGMLRVRPAMTCGPEIKIRLVPYRWWPDLPEATLRFGELEARFSALGGPFRRGLIVASSSGVESDWRVVGRYDLDDSGEAAIGTSPPVSTLDLAEAASFEAWSEAPSSDFRRFQAALSPIALFLDEVIEDVPFRSAVSEFVAATNSDGGTGSAIGFGPQPFLPVLIESRLGIARLGWTSEASEFAFSSLPPGSYRVRTLDILGRVTFAKGIHVGSGLVANLPNGVWTHPDFGESESREIMGFVRWEGGAPAANAAVWMQHSSDFRRLLKNVQSDGNGFFRVEGVVGDESYFAFALPPGEKSSLRNFVQFNTSAASRESWLELTLSPHRIIGELSGSWPGRTLRLLRIESGGEKIVSSFEADASGHFAIANLAHGRFRVEHVDKDGAVIRRSDPIQVTEGRSAATVRWNEFIKN